MIFTLRTRDNHRRCRLALVGALLCAVATGHAAETLRCKEDFVRRGDTKYEVLEACGEPKFRDRISGEEGRQVEQWVYDSEWSRFDRMLTFVSGRLVRIERLDD